MPQIPELNYGPRPDGQAPRASVPQLDGGAKAIGDVSNLAAGVAGIAEKNEAAEQARLDAINEQRQAIHDTVTTARSGADFDAQLGNVSDSIKQQFLESPEKARDAFVTAARQMADGAVQAAPNGTVALGLAKHTNGSLTRGTADVDDWITRRQTQMSKNALSAMSDAMSRNLENLGSVEHVEYQLAQNHKQLDPLFTQLTPDPGKAAREFDAKIWMGWARQRSNVSGAAALDVLAAVDDKKGPLANHLDSDDLDKVRKFAQASFKGAGETAKQRALQSTQKDMGNLISLYASGDPKFPGVAYALQQTTEMDIRATKEDRGMPAEAKAAKLKTLDTHLKALDYLETMYRGGAKGFLSSEDQKTRTDLMSRATTFGSKTGDPLGQTLEAGHQLQFDALKAAVQGKVPPSTLAAITDKIARHIAVRQVTEANNTGTHIPLPMDLGTVSVWAEPEQEGNFRLKSLFSKGGVYETATQTQRNDIQEDYMHKLSMAMKKNPESVNKRAAAKMAQESADSLMSLPAGD